MRYHVRNRLKQLEKKSIQKESEIYWIEPRDDMVHIYENDNDQPLHVFTPEQFEKWANSRNPNTLMFIDDISFKEDDDE